jgi:PAS domain S-box-containing protein
MINVLIKRLELLKQVVWLTVFCTITTATQQTMAINSPADTIVVGIYQNPPKLYTNQAGEPSGFFVEILDKIAQEEGWKLIYFHDSWNNCLEKLKTGEIDLLPDVAFSFERNEYLGFNEIPVLESWSEVYVNPRSGISTLSDLDGKRIALLEGSVQQSRFRQTMNGFGYQYETIYASSFPDAFSLVSIGTADAVVVNHFFGETHFESFRLKRTPIIFDPALLHFAVKKDESKYLVETIDNYLDKWLKTSNSFYYQTLRVYLENQLFQPEPHTHFGLVLIIVGMAIFGGAVIFWLRRQVVSKTKNLLIANQNLQKEESKFRSYIENAPFGILVADENGHFIEVNQTACLITGYSSQELVGKNIPDLIPENAQNEAVRHFQRVVTTGKSGGVLPFRTKKGETRFWSVDAVKINNNRFLGFVNDVTVEKLEKTRLNQLGKIVDQSLNEIYMFDIHSLRFLEVNQASLKNTGYTLTEIQEMTPLDINLNLTAKDFNELVQPLVNGEKERVIFETRHFRKDGSFYDAEARIQMMEHDNEKLFSAMVLDITGSKKMENELRKLKNDLEQQVELKTRELKNRIAELEQFHEATIERELRMEELRIEIESLKKNIPKS